MKTTRIAALAAATLLAVPALAHQPPIPENVPKEYTAECGDCHIPYLPALLGDSDWRTILANLEKHYGDNAGLDDGHRRIIEDYLVRNAEPKWKAHFPAGNPPRITSTIWWRAHHMELSDEAWKDERVGSRGNCLACHPKSDRGLYDRLDLTDVPKQYIIERKLPPISLP